MTVDIMSSIDPRMDSFEGTAVARTATPPASDQLSSDDACGTGRPMVYVGLGSWIRDPNVVCHDDAP
jgi:hypothetical protein